MHIPQLLRGCAGEACKIAAAADEHVDGADFLLWQRQLGSGSPAEPATLAEPEPAALLVLLTGMLKICSRRLTNLP